MEQISVIIPAYNAAATLAPCLDSILAQTGAFKLDIIIADDGSTDTTPSVIAPYTLKHPHAVRTLTLPHCGQAAARNRAINIATGRWLIFVDADDLLPRGAIDTLFRAVLASGAPIACGAYTRKLRPSNCPAPSPVNSVDSRQAVATLLHQTDPRLNSSLWGKIFSRALFTNLSLWEGHIYEDLDIMPRLFLAADAIAVTSAVVYIYRRNPRSTLSVWSQPRKDMLSVVMRIMRIHAIAADPLLLEAARDRAFSAACNCLINLIRHHDPDTAARNLCLDIIRATRSVVLRSTRSRLKNRLAALIATCL